MPLVTPRFQGGAWNKLFQARGDLLQARYAHRVRATKKSTGQAGIEPVLVVATPGGHVQHARFTTPQLIAGREAELAIPDDSVSRRHAEFRIAPLAVRDLGSTNGTRVRGQRIGEAWHPIAIGDVVELGDVAVLVRTEVDMNPLIPKRRDERTLSEIDAVIADPATRRLYELVELVAPSALSVVILGETGAGKELVARAIHARSARRAAPFVAINCAAIAPTLLESELFGHVKGAFTGAATNRVGLLEAATGGTLFLDEIGEMPPATQVQLLRVREHREITPVGSTTPVPIDVRFVAATHRDLPKQVAAGTFREDLLFRIAGITLVVPPLRERPEDIEPLARRFLSQLAITDEALAALRAHAWPGNVRELKTTIERAGVLSRGQPIEASHLAFGIGVATAEPVDERSKILAALDTCGGNQSRAAKQLGISRATLVRRLDDFGITRPRKP